MNILGSISSYAIPIFRENILVSLTDQQKKILLIASLAFNFLAACYLIKRCCFQAKELTSNPINANDDKASNDQLEETEKDSFLLNEDPYEDECDDLLNEQEMVIDFKGTAVEDELNKDKKYYFIEKDSKSYLLVDLLNAALKGLQSEKEKAIEKDSEHRGFFFNLNSPAGKTYGSIWVDLSDKIDRIALEIIKNIRQFSIVDWAKTTNQTDCPLSLEAFDKPYILNLNGRTYSKKFILEAIEKSLYKDEPLRLEDMTLQPSKLDRIMLWPNLSLWKTAPKKLAFSTDKIETKDFNESEARSKNIRGFSDFIRTLAPDSNQTLDGSKLYNYYAAARGLSPIANDSYSYETIENLVIQQVHFPKYHPKCGLTFRNILFEKCQINIDCWCGIKVKSSKMVDCTIDLTNHSRQTTLKKTKLVNCKIIVNHLKSIGTYPHIERDPRVLDYILNIVENTSDLENCTLEVVP